MELFNTTVYTKENVLRFQRFNARIFKKAAASTHILFAVLFAMLITGLVYSIVIKGWIFTAIIALGMAVFGRRYYFLYIGPVRKFDQSSFKDARQEYVFRKSGLSATMDGEEKKFSYQQLLAAYETTDAFYLYINKAQAFLVDKSGFTQGTAEELARRLYNGLGPKHYVRVK